MSDLAILCQPKQFSFNPDTAKTNAFMQKSEMMETEQVQAEFQQFLDTMRDTKIPFEVLPNPGNDDVPTPDAVFVNNWFCYMPAGELVTFPMKTINRGLERNNLDKLREILLKHEFTISKEIDLSHHEAQGLALESTGSMVFDHPSRKVFAAISERTDENILNEFAKAVNYTPCVFHATDKNQQAIYHTNVVMMILNKHVVACLECVTDLKERQNFAEQIAKTGKELIEITLDQVYRFCGNCIDLQVDHQSHLMVSAEAWLAFTIPQRLTLESNYRVHAMQIPVIEKVGGGSVRCMIAKISREI